MWGCSLRRRVLVLKRSPFSSLTDEPRREISGTTLCQMPLRCPGPRQRERNWNRRALTLTRSVAENRGIAHTSVPRGVHTYHVCAPALLLAFAEDSSYGMATLSPEQRVSMVFDAFHQYRSKQDGQRNEAFMESTASGTGAVAVLATDVGAAWLTRGAESKGVESWPQDSEMSIGTLLAWAAQTPECSSVAVTALAALLVEQQAQGLRTDAEFTRVIAHALKTACPLHVGSIVCGLQHRAVVLRTLRDVGAATTDDGEETDARTVLARWKDAVPATAAKMCLQQISDTVRTQRGRRDALPASTLQALHAGALCELPSGLARTDTLRTEMSILSMSSLKYATYPQLAALYTYLDREHATVPAVVNKFLANTGMLLGDANADRRVWAALGGEAFWTVLQTPPPADGAVALVAQAVQALCRSGRDVEYIEEGLVHGCSALAAMGHHGEVRAVYNQFPTLRATPHLVSMYIAEGDVPSALNALQSLASSRAEGWVRLPPIVHHTVVQTCELVGRIGEPRDVAPLYRAVVNFHNAGMVTSQVLESVMAGISERIRRLSVSLEAESSVTPPRVWLARVIPITKAALTFIGDDVNTDMLLVLLETAVETGSMAVPLTSALMWALRQATSLSIRELFSRVDASTHHLPFLYYYVLCFARDRGLTDVVEHLSAVWQVDAQPILQRAPNLSPAYKLWKCAGCGRLNSDRFNYCLCSTLRNGLVTCASCGYSQDERWPACLSCGHSMNKENVCGGVVRKSWACAACKAANPARQTLLCFRCGAPTGPLFQQPPGTGHTPVHHACHGNAPLCSRACSEGCSRDRDVAYVDKVGYCRACGQFRSQQAARHSLTWRCAGCEQLRSELERGCPDCPQVDCLPATLAHTVTTVRYCQSCGAEEGNAFASVCAQCGGQELMTGHPARADLHAARFFGDSVRVPSPTAADGANMIGTPAATDGVLVLFCPNCAASQTVPADHLDNAKFASATEPHPCRHCGAALTLRANGVTAYERSCPSCHVPLAASSIGALCPHCSHYVPIPSSDGEEWKAPHIQHTFSMLVKQFSFWQPTNAALAYDNSDEGSCSDGPGEMSADPVEVGVQLERLNSFLTGLLRAWRGACGDPDQPAKEQVPAVMTVSTLSEVRVQVMMELNLLLGKLKPLMPVDPVARRCAAQMKQLMTWIDAACHVTSTSGHFAPHETCHECLGGHPVELCPFFPLDASNGTSGGASADLCVWTCAECDARNTNEDVCRYLCTSCLALRPLVQEMLVSECWECGHCHRANVEFETYCTHCGVARPVIPVSSVTSPDAVVATSTSLPARGGGDEFLEGVRSDKGNIKALELANHIPFVPSRCALCGLVYLEAECPLCSRHLPDVAEAKGVVCAVGKRHAYIQPIGSHRLEDRIFVSERLVRRASLSEGKVVRYLAELQRGDHGAGFRATYVRE